MKEINSGADRQAPHKPLPENAVPVGGRNSYRVRFSPTEGLIVESSSYHPDLLCISPDELRAWVK